MFFIGLTITVWIVSGWIAARAFLFYSDEEYSVPIDASDFAFAFMIWLLGAFSFVGMLCVLNKYMLQAMGMRPDGHRFNTTRAAFMRIHEWLGGSMYKLFGVDSLR